MLRINKINQARQNGLKVGWDFNNALKVIRRGQNYYNAHISAKADWVKSKPTPYLPSAV